MKEPLDCAESFFALNLSNYGIALILQVSQSQSFVGILKWVFKLSVLKRRAYVFSLYV